MRTIDTPLLALVLLLTACPPKASTPDVLAAGQSIDVATVLESVDDPATTTPPERLGDALQARLSERNLTVRPVSELPAGFLTGHSSDARLDVFAQSASGDLLMMLEARPVFDTQLAGRFRWNVAVTLTLAERSDLESARTQSWDIPVFVQFYHQQEPEALAEATPMIERHMNGALDEFIGSL